MFTADNKTPFLSDTDYAVGSSRRNNTLELK